MATKEPKIQMGSDEFAETDDEEKWVTHYSSNHQILLVGEGDFSFSLSLATAFGSASNMCASSLDSYDTLIKKYKKAKLNLENLVRLGASLLHEVDATKMKFNPDLAKRKFDRIIFNFPHAGFHGKEDNAHMIQMHTSLVHGFFCNARGMLRADGEIHVNHKNNAPFSHWNLEDLASRSSLALIQRVGFNKEDYPGYNNKRGDGSRCDDPFPVGDSSTFKFRFSDRALASRSSLLLIQRVGFNKEDYPGYNNERGDGSRCDDPFPVGDSSTFKFRFSDRALASRSSLALIQRVGFNKEDYPGYNNKIGDGSTFDDLFPVGDSSTFKFRFSDRAQKVSKATTSLGSIHKMSEQFQNGIPMQMPLQPTSYDLNYPQRNCIPNTSLGSLCKKSEQFQDDIPMRMPLQPASYDFNYPQRNCIPTTSLGSMHKKSEQFQNDIPMQMVLQPTSDFNYPQRNCISTPSLGSMYRKSEQFQNGITRQMPLQPTSSDFIYPQRNCIVNDIHNRNHYSRRFHGNLNGVAQTYRRNYYDVAQSVPERMRFNLDACYYGSGEMRHGLERQMLWGPRTLKGDLDYVHELHHTSNLRLSPHRPQTIRAYQLNAPNANELQHCLEKKCSLGQEKEACRKYK